MTPEETKRYIERRLGDLGWNLHIGKAAYDKIFRFTEGKQDGTDEICHKLLSLGALQERREINDDVVSMAMTDLSPNRERRPRNETRADAEFDLASIEQLTAVLEDKVAKGEVEPEIEVLERPARTARTPKPAALPRIMVVAAASDRATYVKALGRDFDVVQAHDGEQAWKALLEQPDIELVITDSKAPDLDANELIARVRTAMSPPHLVGVPIVVVAGTEEASTKLRLLMAGANDFILKDASPEELRARVIARHRLSKSMPRPAVATPRNLDVPPRSATRRTTPVAAVPEAPAAPPLRAAKATADTARRHATPQSITAERRYPSPRAVAAGGAVTTRESFLRYLYRVSSTTTITLSATVLLVLALIVIVLIGRSDPPTRATASSSDGKVAASPSPRIEGRDPEVTAAPTLPAEPPAAQPPATTRPELVGPPAPPSVGAAPTAKANNSPTKTGAEAPVVRNGESANIAARVEPPKPASPTRSDVPATAPSTRPEASRPDVAKSEPIKPPASAATPAPARPAAPAPAEPAPASRESVAAAPPAVASAPPAPVKITREELTSFLKRFASIYEAGDLEQFLNLFADNARTNDRTGRRGIREDYESLFRATDLRRMKLGEINWEIDASQAYGWGDFDVTVRRANDPEPYVYTGSLTFVVEKVDGRLRITRLYHGQRRAESG